MSTTSSNGHGGDDGDGSRRSPAQGKDNNISGPGPERELSVGELKNLIHEEFVKAGPFWPLLKHKLSGMLIDEGWNAEIRESCYKYIREKERSGEHVNISHMIADLGPSALYNIPASVKKESINYLSQFAKNRFPIGESLDELIAFRMAQASTSGAASTSSSSTQASTTGTVSSSSTQANTTGTASSSSAQASTTGTASSSSAQASTTGTASSSSAQANTTGTASSSSAQASTTGTSK